MEVESSTDPLSEYELQLSQVIAALKSTPKGDEYDSLVSLKADLEELINLTNGAENNQQSNDFQPNSIETSNDNDLDDEYALFMKELSKTETPSDTSENKNEDDDNIKSQEIDNDIASLEGTQCALYFSNRHGGAPSLYNAMICSVTKNTFSKTGNDEDITAKIMFTNPTHIEMVPCPYYLDGECKFDEFECRFSHGETVPLKSLKEATKPVFTNLKVGSRVLAKIKKNEDTPMSIKQSEKYLLWHRAIVRYLDADNCTCEVQLENNIFSTSSAVNYTVDFENIFPLIGSESDVDSMSDSDISDVEPSLNDSIVEKSLTNNLDSVKLGEWEKHTKGIGSKLMKNMGYVVGTGLGPQGEGRILPVTCTITPSGRSLDHCMKLREESSSEDPLKVEKRLRRLEKKKEEREKKAYEKLVNREKHDVFKFLNKTLSGEVQGNLKNPGDDSKSSKTKDNLNVKTSSCKNLNIEKFKLEEDIRRIEKDVVKLKDSMARNVKNSSVHNGLSVKLSSKMDEIDQLKRKQTNISNEQNNRKDKRKLTVF